MKKILLLLIVMLMASCNTSKKVAKENELVDLSTSSTQERKQEEVQHPVLAHSLALGLVPLVQARLVARAIREEVDANGQVSGYLPFLVR